MLASHSQTWLPITDLPLNWKESLSSPSTEALVKAWLEQAGELREKDLYRHFLSKLQRQWAIETGVIEGLYALSEGATLSLIEKGLDASLISHDDTDQSPSDVILKIQDQHQAVQGLYQFVSGQRPLGTSYLRELHQVLTAHQPTYTARDTLGNVVERELPRGMWKLVPNNVEHPDGTGFQFCPPEHVAQEMDNLIEMHHRHVEANIPPDVEAAWLHHRFVLIHPFTDGNGRVARCLATLILLRANWLPLVVTRHDRSAYIAALRAADANDLRPLVDLIGELQRKAIREALSLTEDVIQEATAVKSILDSVKDKFSQRKKNLSQLLNRAVSTADSLQVLAGTRLAELAQDVSQTITGLGAGFTAWASSAIRESEKAQHHYIQIVQCAQKLNYFANLGRYQAWACLTIQTNQRTEILFSFHGIGHHESGIFGCSTMIYSREKLDTGEGHIGEIIPLSTDPFEFTYTEDTTDVQRRFRKWLDQCSVKGLDHWQRTV